MGKSSQRRVSYYRLGYESVVKESYSYDIPKQFVGAFKAGQMDAREDNIPSDTRLSRIAKKLQAIFPKRF